MPGIKIKLETDAAEKNAKSLRKELDHLGRETKDLEQGTRKLSKTLGNTSDEKKAAHSYDDLSKSLSKTARASARLKTSSRGVDTSMGSMSKGMSGINGMMTKLVGTVGVLAGAYGLKMLSSSFLDAATKAESYRTRLNVLLGSQEEGNKMFQEMATLAQKVPFQYEEIMQAATNLSGVMRGGVSEVSEYMPMIADLAAAYGMSIEEVTGQVIRMYSAGAGAADMFRERGVLAMMGFQSGVKYSTEETKNMMFSAWDSASSKFKGAADALGATWEGMTSMLGDAWFQFRNLVMDAGVFDWMKEQIAGVLRSIRSLSADGSLKAWAQNIGAAFKATISGVQVVFSAISAVFNSLRLAISTAATLFFRTIESMVRLAIKTLRFFKMDKIADSYEKQLKEIAKLTKAAEVTNDQFAKSLQGNFDDIESGMAGMSYAWEENASGMESALDGVEVGVERVGKSAEKTTKKMEALNKTLSAAEYKKLAKDWWGFGDAIGSASDNLGVHMSTLEDYNKVIGKSGDETKKATGEIVSATDTMVESISSSIGGSLTAVFQGEFNGIGGAWKDMLNSMYSSFMSWVSNLVSKQVMEPLLNGLGNMLSGLFSGGGSGGLSGLFSGGGSGMLSGLSSLFSGGGSGIGSSLSGIGSSVGTMGWIGMLVAAEHMASGFNQSHGFSDVWVNGKKQQIGDAFSGSYFNDPLMEAVSGLVGGSPGPLAYVDAALKAGDWGEALKGAGAMLLNPLDPLTSALLGNPISKLFGFGKKPSKFRGWTDVKMGVGEEGMFGWGYNGDSSIYPGMDMTGKYITGRGPGDKVTPSLTALDDAFKIIIDGFTESVNTLGNAFGEGPIKDAFWTAMGDLSKDFAYTEEFATRDGEEWSDYLERVLGGLGEELNATFGPTIGLFEQLGEAVTGVIPAFQDLIQTLGQATQAYYDPLLKIDEEIKNAGGEDYLLEDRKKQVEATHMLWDNMINNGANYDQISQGGLDLIEAAKAYNAELEKRFEGLDGEELEKEIAKAAEEGFKMIDIKEMAEGIRDAMTEAFSPEEFNQSILDTLIAFKDGAQEAIDSITDAITELHPNINLDIAVDLDIIGEEVETQYEVVPS